MWLHGFMFFMDPRRTFTEVAVKECFPRVGGIYHVAGTEGPCHISVSSSSWCGDRVTKDTCKSYAITFEKLRGRLDLFVCFLSLEEILNSKQASFPFRESAPRSFASISWSLWEEI